MVENVEKEPSNDNINGPTVFLKYDPRRVKKDVLYKPLFRIFRSLLRN